MLKKDKTHYVKVYYSSTITIIIYMLKLNKLSHTQPLNLLHIDFIFICNVICFLFFNGI